MKLIRRLLTLALAVLMVLSLGATALADTYVGEIVVTTSCTVSFNIGAEATEAGVTAPAAAQVGKGGVLKVDDLPNAIWETQEENPVPVKCLVGWYLDEALTQRVDADLTVNENVTLYAMWAEHIPGCSEECEDEECGCFCHITTIPESRIGPDGNYILVSKVFVGLPSELLSSLSNFSINVTPKGATAKSYPLTGTPEDVTDPDNPNVPMYKYTWEVTAEEGVYEYTIGESSQVGDMVGDYELVDIKGLGNVTVTAEKVDLTGFDYITPAANARISLEKAPDGWVLVIAANTGNPKKNIVLSDTHLSGEMRKAIETANYRGNFDNDIWIYYNLADHENEKVPIEGVDITYVTNATPRYLQIGATCNWSTSCLVGYDHEDAKYPTAAITNTYVRKTTEATIKKIVTGNMGEVNKSFEFEVTCSESFDGATLNETDNLYHKTFNLTNGNSETLTGLKIDAVLTITENNADGYKMLVDGVEITDGSYEYTVTKNETEFDVVVENNKDVLVDTGIFLDSLPYVLILGVVVVGFLFLRKRRHDDD